MRQVFHIFQKDVRRLWPYAAIALVLLAAFARFDILSSPVNIAATQQVNAAADALKFFVPLSFFLLIALLVFQEPLPGDRHYWFSRPYRRPALLASKLLFLAVFVNFPLLLSDIYILAAQGFPVLSVIQQLLQRQLFLTLILVLPPFVMASFTTGLLQFLLGWFILLLIVISEQLIQTFFVPAHTGIAFGGTGLSATVLALIGCGIVLWQYLTRRTGAARFTALITAFSFLPVFLGLAYLAPGKAIDSPPPPAANNTNVRIGYDLGRALPPPIVKTFGLNNRRVATAWLPIRVTGVQPATLLRGHGFTTIQVSGARWPAAGVVFSSDMQRAGGEYYQTITIGLTDVNSLKGKLASVYTSFQLEVVNDKAAASVPLSKPSFTLPGVGVCRSYNDARQSALTCRTGLSPNTETALRLDAVPDPDAVIANWPSLTSVPLGLSPTTDFEAIPSGEPWLNANALFIPRRKIADFGVALNGRDLDLLKYSQLPAAN